MVEEGQRQQYYAENKVNNWYTRCYVHCRHHQCSLVDAHEDENTFI